MKIRTLTLTLALATGAGLIAADDAEARKPYKNLKVLKDNGKTLEKGMKNITKGLGVKCKACHVKGEFESDKHETKVKARDFFRAVVGEKDAAKRKAALADLQKLLKLDKVRKEERIWKGVEMLEKAK